MSGDSMRIIENIGVILLMTLFTVLAINIFPLLLLIFPYVFIVFGVKNGLIPSLFSMIIVTMAVGAIVDVYSGLFIFMVFAPIAMIISYGIKTRRKPAEILGASALVFFVITLLISGYLGSITGASLVAQMEESFKSILNMQLELFKEMGVSNDELTTARETLENAYNYILSVLPTLLILLSIFISYLNYLISSLTLRKMGLGVVNIPRFSKFRLPNNISSGIIVMFISMFIIRSMDISNYDAILINLIVLISFMFLIQGLAIIDFYLLKVKMLFVFRLIMLSVIVFITPLVSIITILGLVDTLFDFRKIKKQRS